MSPHIRDLMLRAGEAVRIAAAKAACGVVLESDRRRLDADYLSRMNAGRAAGQVNVAAIVDQVAEHAPTVAERRAFLQAAAAQRFNCGQGPTGEFYYTDTTRAEAIWNAAVRWAYQQADQQRLPAPQDKAGTGVAAD